MKRFGKVLAALTLALTALTLASEVRADWCAEDFSVVLGPYETQTFRVCSVGNPEVSAMSAYGEDVDLFLYTVGGRFLDQDTDYDGVPEVTAWASGYHEYLVKVHNSTGDYVLATVSVR